MPANSNVPIGRLPWRLTAAPPGTLDILVDVQDPISWEVGNLGSGGTGRLTEPLCSQFPVLTTRGNVRGMKGKFTLFIPDTTDRDDVLDALIDASRDTTVPYYVWRALDGSQSWNVQFDPSEKPTIGYLSGYRTFICSFLQMTENLSTVPPGFIAGVTPPAIVGKPTVSTRIRIAYRGEYIPVKFTNVPAGDTSAFIGLFPTTDTTNTIYGAISYIYLGGATAAELFLPTLPTATEATYELRLITSNHQNVVYGPKVVIKAATLTATSVTLSSVDITWAGFTDDLPKLAQYAAPGLAPVDSKPISGSSGTIGLSINPSDITPTTRMPQLVLASGRIIKGPLS